MLFDLVSYKEFHIGTTLTNNWFFLTSELASHLAKLRCTLVALVLAAPSLLVSGENQVLSWTSNFPVRIVYVSTMSPLSLLACNVVSPSLSSLSS